MADVEDRAVDPRDYQMIFSLGSEFAAFDDSVPWLGKEKRLLLDAARNDVPVLGICFGGQLLARALGAPVVHAPEPEIGVIPVSLLDDDPFLDGLEHSIYTAQFHVDTFALPERNGTREHAPKSHPASAAVARDQRRALLAPLPGDRTSE